MTKSRTLLALLFSSAALAACGGGGGSGEEASAAVPAPAPAPAVVAAPAPAPAPAAPAVSAPYAPGATPAYLMLSVGGQSFGQVKTHVQQADGAVTAINDISLTGVPVVADVSGDASFAMGRWAGGTVNTSTGTQSFTANSAWHYLAYNVPVAFPVSATTLSCEAGNFTSPNYVGGTSSSVNFGHTTGSATLAFAGGQANVGVTLVVEAGSNVTKAVTTTVTRGSTSVAGGGIGAGLDSVYVTIGDGGNGAFTVQGGYELKLLNGARYAGVYRFRCH